MKRLATDLFILTAILTCPYWVYLPIMVLALVFIPFYWEVVVFGLLIDVLLGLTQGPFFVPFGLLFAVLALIAIPLRKYIRFNA